MKWEILVVSRMCCATKVARQVQELSVRIDYVLFLAGSSQVLYLFETPSLHTNDDDDDDDEEPTLEKTGMICATNNNSTHKNYVVFVWG